MDEIKMKKNIENLLNRVNSVCQRETTDNLLFIPERKKGTPRKIKPMTKVRII